MNPKRTLGGGLGPDYDALLREKVPFDISPEGAKDWAGAQEAVAYLEQNPELLPYYDALISQGELPNDALAGAINDYIADQNEPQPDYWSDIQGFASNERERRRRQRDLGHLRHPVLRGKPGGRP